MASFGERSRSRMIGVHTDLCHVAEEVVKDYDCTIPFNGGHRTKEIQNGLYPTYSKKKWPYSYHNCTAPRITPGGFILFGSSPVSLAIDLVPYYKTEPHIDWNDTEGFYHFAGLVRGIARSMGVPITWGGDWDGDYDLDDQSFYDLGHFQLDVNRDAVYMRLWQDHLNANA